MHAALTPDSDQLADALARTERRRQRAAKAEQVAYDRWQRAYTAHEIAADTATAAWQAYSAAVT